jgi:hypothetical protein
MTLCCRRWAPVRNHRNGVRNRSEQLSAFVGIRNLPQPGVNRAAELNLFISRKRGNPMCDKCVDLDRKIEHYRKLASAISDPLTIEGVADLIKAMEARKVQLHLERKE